MSKEMNMFEYATRNKLRFPYKGQISVEDLWDLSLSSLDAVFKNLNKQLKTAKEESLLETKSKEDEVLEIQIDIVKYIVAVKQTEAKVKLQAKENKEKKEKLLAILADKEKEEYQNMSADEIRKLISEM
mgnify:CR=1 FL=1